MQYNFDKLTVKKSKQLLAELNSNGYVSFYIQGFKVSISTSNRVVNFFYVKGDIYHVIAVYDYVTGDLSVKSLFGVVITLLFPLFKELILS